MANARPIATSLPGAPLRVNAPLAILPRLAELLRCAGRIQGPECAAELHATRIAVKRLRYTVEIFSGALEGADDFLRLFKQFQDFLGEIHDADVLIPLLERDMRHGARAGVRALLDRTVHDRAHLYDDFMAAWAKACDEGFPARLRAVAFAAASGEADPKPDDPEAEARALLAIAGGRLDTLSSSELARLHEALQALDAALSATDEDGRRRAEAVRAAIGPLWKLITTTGA